MQIYVGNLPYDFTEDELRDMFDQFGEVVSAKLVTDKVSGVSKGFGFIEMERKSEGKDAIQVLDQSAVRGRNVRVHAARPRNGRTPRHKNKRRSNGQSDGDQPESFDQAPQNEEDAALG
ncbi:RNA recognition motif domain-containing protein [Pseudomonadota bacterium]